MKRLHLPDADHPGQDPVVRQLERAGLLPSSTLLRDYTKRWSIKECPWFLKQAGEDWPFVRLAQADLATLRRLGEANEHLGQVKVLVDPYGELLKLAGPYRSHAGRRQTTDARVAHFRLFCRCMGSLFTSLSSAMDSFALVVALVCGWEQPIKSLTLGSLRNKLKGNAARRTLKRNELALKAMGRILSPLLDGVGDESGWYDLFVGYRNLYAHRPMVFCVYRQEPAPVIDLSRPQEPVRTYMQKNPTSLMRSPRRTTPQWHRSARSLLDDVTDVEAADRQVLVQAMQDYMTQPLHQYLPGLFLKVSSVLDAGYGLLSEVYKKRESRRYSYRTNYLCVFPDDWVNAPVAFRRFVRW